MDFLQVFDRYKAFDVNMATRFTEMRLQLCQQLAKEAMEERPAGADGASYDVAFKRCCDLLAVSTKERADIEGFIFDAKAKASSASGKAASVGKMDLDGDGALGPTRPNDNLKGPTSAGPAAPKGSQLDGDVISVHDSDNDSADELGG